MTQSLPRFRATPMSGMPLVAIGPSSIDEVRAAARKALLARHARVHPPLPAVAEVGGLAAWLTRTGMLRDPADAAIMAKAFDTVQRLTKENEGIEREIKALEAKHEGNEAAIGRLLNAVRPWAKRHAWLKIVAAAGVPYRVITRGMRALAAAGYSSLDVDGIGGGVA